MNKPLFTVIVPVYNREQLIVRCLDSIRAQTYRPIDLIVVDNVSTDQTVPVIREWAALNESVDFRVQVVEEGRKGAAAARQCGLELVHSEWVIFFDSDDAMRPYMLETIAAAIESSDNIDMICWRYLRHDNGGKKIMSRLPRYTARKPLKAHMLHTVLATHSYTVKTNFLRNVGGWDPSLLAWNDYELGVRLLLNGPRMKILRQVLYDVYCQEKSITGLSFSHSAGRWEESLDACELDIKASACEDKDYYIRLVAYRRMILAAHYRREGNREAAFRLEHDTMEKALANKNAGISGLQRFILKMAYAYTVFGGRGAHLFVTPFLI